MLWAYLARDILGQTLHTFIKLNYRIEMLNFPLFFLYWLPTLGSFIDFSAFFHRCYLVHMILFGKEKLNAYYKYFQYNMRIIFFAPQPVKRMCWVCSQEPSRIARSLDHTLQIQTTCNTTADTIPPHVRMDFFALNKTSTFLAIYNTILKFLNIANFSNAICIEI